MWQKRITAASIILTSLLVVSVVFALIQSSREAARKTQSKYNLKYIGLALYNYESTYQAFPSGGVFDLEGRGFHGWMTSILCFIDASPCPEINFKTPWDSTQNAGVFLNPIPVYENPSEPACHRHWEFPVAHYAANSHLLAINSFVKLKSIEDTEHVFLVGELDGSFLPWGCPYNWYELGTLNAKPPTFGRSTRDGCQFLFVDGSVKFIANKVSRKVFKDMAGDDLSEFTAATLNIQTPSDFHVQPTHFGRRGVSTMATLSSPSGTLRAT